MTPRSPHPEPIRSTQIAGEPSPREIQRTDPPSPEIGVDLAHYKSLLKLEASERLRPEELASRHAAIIELIPDAVIACAEDGRILFWNEGATKIYGWACEAARGKLVQRLFYAPDSREFASILSILLQKNEFRAEENHLHESGRTLSVESRWRMSRNAKGEPEEILLVTKDVTEQKELERQCLRMQRLETVGLLASGIAHDLNNVLAPVLMGSQNLLHEIKDPVHVELLQSIEVSARRGGALVHQILSFARGAEGERVPLQIKQLIHEFQKVARDTFPRSIHIITRCAANVHPVLGNRTQLYQAIMNLCLNARDAMQNGGILQIETENIFLDSDFVSRYPPAAPGEYVVLKIIDNGIGIPDEVQDRIFDPFFTTKETGKGTGLGLSTVLGIIKRHGGFLIVTSRVGRGTKFTIYLPATEPVSSTDAETPESVIPSGNGKIVLLVDDERIMRDITGSILKKNGYKILTAADGTEGFALYTQNKEEIAAVITDMSMPYMDGAKMIRALHQIDPKVKIIAISGLNEDLKTIPEIPKKKIPFLKKPFTVEQLLEALHALFEDAPIKNAVNGPSSRSAKNST